MEEWRDIPSLPEYEASSLGRVRRRLYRRAMPNGGTRWYGGKAHIGQWAEDANRFIFVFRGKTYKVHQIVCEAFNGPKPFNMAVVMHEDEDSSNNVPTNLVWGTQKQNLNAPGFIKYCKGRTGANNPYLKGRIK